MPDLDSRLLRAFDCFGQKFSKPGKHTYGLSGAGGAGAQPFTIQVAAAAGAKPAQHQVVVKFQGGRFEPDADPLTIGLGDMVTWKDPNVDDPPFTVFGSGPIGDFSNAKMVHESIYTHVFISPRTYQWVDANGGAHKGTVTVTQVAAKTTADYNTWPSSIQATQVVHINGGNLQNANVQVPLGGTVCWAIENTPPGLAVADGLLPGVKKAQT